MYWSRKRLYLKTLLNNDVDYWLSSIEAKFATLLMEKRARRDPAAATASSSVFQ